ncbi:MAG: succinoglycan biosynthesis transport protein ExoP, partial [Verrucomicrobiales bacterium]
MNEQGASSEAKLHAMDYWQVLRNRYGVILLAFFLVFMTAAVITYILPKEYLGKVTMQINRELHDWKIFHGGEAPSGRMYVPPTFIETEFKVITSKKTLYDVVDALKLDERWAITRPQAFRKLFANLETREERGTDLINIEYYDTEGQLAANIANAVANAYQQRRVKLESTRSNNALDTLQRQLKDQSDKVE